MHFSTLQKYMILLVFELAKGKFIGREQMQRFYDTMKARPERPEKSVAQSIERLIARGIFIGYGYRVAHRWYIQKVRLTPEGKKVAKRLLGEQQTLPFRFINSYLSPYARHPQTSPRKTIQT